MGCGVAAARAEWGWGSSGHERSHARALCNSGRSVSGNRKPAGIAKSSQELLPGVVVVCCCFCCVCCVCCCCWCWCLLLLVLLLVLLVLLLLLCCFCLLSALPAELGALLIVPCSFSRLDAHLPAVTTHRCDTLCTAARSCLRDASSLPLRCYLYLAWLTVPLSGTNAPLQFRSTFTPPHHPTSKAQVLAAHHTPTTPLTG